MGQEEKQNAKLILYSIFCQLVFKHDVCEYFVNIRQTMK